MLNDFFKLINGIMGMYVCFMLAYWGFKYLIFKPGRKMINWLQNIFKTKKENEMTEQKCDYCKSFEGKKGIAVIDMRYFVPAYCTCEKNKTECRCQNILSVSLISNTSEFKTDKSNCELHREKKELRLEDGKRYRNRRGEIVPVMRNPGGIRGGADEFRRSDRKFVDHQGLYYANGRVWRKGECKDDLIEEYIEEPKKEETKMTKTVFEVYDHKKKTEEVKKVYLKVYKSLDECIVIRCVDKDGKSLEGDSNNIIGWITPDGKLNLNPAINPDLGFQLDEQGRIKIDE